MYKNTDTYNVGVILHKICLVSRILLVPQFDKKESRE